MELTKNFLNIAQTLSVIHSDFNKKVENWKHWLIWLTEYNKKKKQQRQNEPYSYCFLY